MFIKIMNKENAIKLWKIIQEAGDYLNKKYEIVVTIITIIVQMERFASNCFNLEFVCKKLGSINIRTPIRKMTGTI